MTKEELTREIYDLIDVEDFSAALDCLRQSFWGEVRIENDRLALLLAYVHDNGLTFEEACCLWWALPEGKLLDEEGCITLKGEAVMVLHRAILHTLKTFGVEKVLGNRIEPFDVAVPPTVILSLAEEWAKGHGVHPE